MYICWEELDRPDLNTIQGSLFMMKGLSYLDLSTPPTAITLKAEKLFLRFYGGKNKLIIGLTKLKNI